jgi:hypothetical protein
VLNIQRGAATLLPHQLALVGDRTSRIKVLQGGYRSGKTVAGVAAVVDMAFRSGGFPILVVEPTYRMVVDVFVATARRMLDAWKLPYVWHKTDKILTIGRRKQVEILCRSADEPRSLEGITAGGLLVDEWELCDVEALTTAMARVSMGPCQQIVLTGTPEGYGPAYEMILAKPSPDVRQWSVTSSANSYLSSTYVESMRQRMDDSTASEKLDGVRTAKGGRVYGRFDRRVHCVSPVVVKGTIQIACDFNVRYMHWIVVETDQSQRTTHVVGEVIKEGGTTTDEHAERVAQWIAQYLTRTRGRHYTRDDVYQMRLQAFVDASGTALRSTSTKSDVALLTQAGFRPIHGNANPPVKDRVNTLNVLFRDRRVTVDASAAPVLTRALETQALDRNGDPDKRGDIDHGIDALGYLCHWQWPVHRPRANQTTPGDALTDEWGRV